jgi:hypothetical protein|tara:strand:- start:318 stop:815 length:498 start_codon:yes stop_codon:yes gene_type:complete
MAFASGNKAWGISDRSGRRYRLRTMQKEWTGSLVGPDEFEVKHPQLFPPRISPDPQAIQNARPDRVEPAVEVILRYNPFISGNAGSSVLTVIEPGHSRLTGSTVRFRNVAPFNGFSTDVISRSIGYTITKVDSSSYTFTVTETATTEGVRGGGDFVSAGPVTVEA